jgi:hypothetical protein
VQQQTYRIRTRRRRGKWILSAPELPADAPHVRIKNLGNGAPLMIEAIAGYLGLPMTMIEVEVEPPRRRRARGVTPSAVQVLGGVACLTGVYLAAGLAVTLIAAGAVLAALGVLRESGRI